MKQKRDLDASDAPICFACGVILTKTSAEKHHFPIPGRLGGKDTVPLCTPCHDMVDRIDLIDWPADWAYRAVADAPREAKLYAMKIISRLSVKSDFGRANDAA